MTMEENKVRIRQFLSCYFTANLQDEDDIFQLGFVNSMFAMQLVIFMEKEFGIVIEDEDLEIENFNSVGALARLAERKLMGAASSAD